MCDSCGCGHGEATILKPGEENSKNQGKISHTHDGVTHTHSHGNHDHSHDQDHGHSHDHSHDHDDDKEHVSLQLDDLVEDHLVRTRRLLLIGEIDDMLSAQICSYLQFFTLTNEPVYMYINSPGGCLSSGYAIIDQMKMCSCPIYTIVRGEACSMAALIAIFGDKGCRYATTNSSIMLHSVVIQSLTNPIDLHMRMSEYLKVDYEQKTIEIAKRLKISTKHLRTLMKDTEWMNPQKAIKIGVVDNIWTPSMERLVNTGSM